MKFRRREITQKKAHNTEIFWTCLKPNGYDTYRHIEHSHILRSAHTVYLCVLCGSQNGDYFPVNINWSGFIKRERVYCAVRAESLNTMRVL